MKSGGWQPITRRLRPSRGIDERAHHLDGRAPVYLVVGARPNFMKIAPIMRALEAGGFPGVELIHTGQHYDEGMSEVFFRELGIKEPDHNLAVGSGTQAEQTARIMVRFEALCLTRRPALVVVVGDVNSTMACSIVAKKMGISLAHVEAGLRSGDWRMPEEINRVITDRLADYCFVTEPSGVSHLRTEGVPEERIHYVGNVMVDNLLFQLERMDRHASSIDTSAALKAHLGRYGVITLHRPDNVDDVAALTGLVSALAKFSQELPLVFPVHPRTRSRLAEFGIGLPPEIHITDPMSYMDFLNLWKDAAVVLTDSGGLQEETTALGVPCVTLRNNTERPITVSEGTNVLAGTQPGEVLGAARDALTGRKAGRRPQYWDGHAAERLVEILRNEAIADADRATGLSSRQPFDGRDAVSG